MLIYFDNKLYLDFVWGLKCKPVILIKNENLIDMGTKGKMK